MTSMFWRARRAISSQTGCASSKRPGSRTALPSWRSSCQTGSRCPRRYRSCQFPDGSTSKILPHRLAVRARRPCARHTVAGVREPGLHTARAAYDAIAAVYADMFKDTLDDRPTERALLAAFAEVIQREPAGLVADLGCGPGHIAAHLRGLGLSVLGVDQSAQMLAIGRTRYPEVRFALGSITRLGLADGSCRGALSRSSVIHLPPRLLPTALAAIARAYSLPAAGC